MGCPEPGHKESLTKAVINIYAIRRAVLISKQYGKIHDEARIQEKSYRKRSKLVTAQNRKEKLAKILAQPKQKKGKNQVQNPRKKPVQRRIKKVPKSSQSIRNNNIIKKDLKRL